MEEIRIKAPFNPDVRQKREKLKESQGFGIQFHQSQVDKNLSSLRIKRSKEKL